MNRVRTVLLLCCPLLAGCAMCCSEDDYNYSAFGGSWQRSDMSHGRVGSAFGFAGESAIMQPFEAGPVVAPPSSIDILPTPAATIGGE